MKKVRVCGSGSCSAFGAERVMEAIHKGAGLRPGEKNDKIDLDWCGCLGYCSKSPNVEVDDNSIVFSSKPKTIMSEIESGGEDVSGRELDIESAEEYFDNNFLYE